MGNFKRRIAHFVGVLLTVTGLVAIAPPAMAGGGSVMVLGNDITFTGTAATDTVITGSNYEPYCNGARYCVFFHDPGGITSFSGCQYDNSAGGTQTATLVACSTPGPARVFINLGAGNDTYTSDPKYPNVGTYQSVTVDGGDGNDLLSGGGAPETLSGGAGDDVIYPDQGPNVTNVGPDTLFGGAGSDVVYYSQSAGQAAGIRLSLNNTADDGSSLPGDIDNVGSDFEGHVLGSGSDTAVGDARSTTFYGLEGDDRLDAGAGDDGIVGGHGNDTIDGGPGVDRIWGDSDRDPAQAGNDTIVTNDGESDQVTCGPGTDAVTADSLDKILDACESVTTGGGTTLSAEVAVTKTRLNANKRRKKATLALQCTGGLPCAGTVVVRTTKGKSRRIAGNKKLALGTFTLAANTTKTVKLKLRKPARKILKQTRRAGVRARLTLTNERVTTFTNLKLTR